MGATIRPAIFALWIAGLLLTLQTHAAEEDANKLVQYIEMQPSFVLNYGPPSPKLTYVKADISLRVDSRAAAAAVEHHMPKLRNMIVLLFSQQEDSVMSSNQGREELRLQALSELQSFLSEEEGSPTIEDLLFTNFVVQK